MSSARNQRLEPVRSIEIWHIVERIMADKYTNLLGDKEVIGKAADAMDAGQLKDLPPTCDTKSAMQRIADAAKEQNATCDETKNITSINSRVQQGHIVRDDLHDADCIANRVVVGTIGQPPVPSKRRTV